MNLPVLFRTRRISQICRTHKALTSGPSGLEHGYAGAAVPRFSFFSKDFVLTPAGLRTERAKVRDGLSACMGGMLKLERGNDTAQ